MMREHPKATPNYCKEDAESTATLSATLSQLRMNEAPLPSSKILPVPPVQPQERWTDAQSMSDSDHETQPFGEGDPLFDEHADSENEAWVRSRLLRDVEKVQETESVSCPGCFSVLSMQVQSHERYEGQFRAVFVMNCKVVRGERLRVMGGETGRRKQGKEEAYQPVACEICGTEVGMLDGEGVYHFCNVFY